MTTRLFQGLSVLVLTAATVSVHAYETVTHDWMTRIAYARSVLKKGSGLLDSIGAQDPDLPSSPGYPVNNDRDVRLSAPDAIAFGVVEEDHFPRPLNHFFDVQHGGRALTVLGVEVGAPSPVWTLEDPEEFFTQHNSLRDANAYFYQAVTSAGVQSDRNFGQLFRSLGQVVHHIQDMAQPQHVRNDAHLSINNFPKPSAYETLSAHTDTLHSANMEYDEEAVVDLHVFDTARKFWNGAGRGMAEFTSTNFVSKDTNFQMSSSGVVSAHDGFPLPAATGCPGQSLLTTQEIDQLPRIPPGLHGPITFVGTPVTDGYLAATQPNTPGLCNPRTSTYSIYDADLRAKGKKSRFALNTYNLEAAQDFLIPRAIAYSAGMLNYFFRGKLKILSTDRQGDAVQLTVRNVSLADFALSDPADANQQAFEVWYDATDGTRKQAQIMSGGRVGSTPLPNLAEQTLVFHMPADVQTGSSKTPFVLVFRGTIGNEAGMIAQVFSAAGGFLLTPSYVADDGIAGRRAILPASGGWSVSPIPDLQAGNVDWRGHQPDDVITWDGPSTRYFGAGSSPAIYSGGRRIANAPGAVVGAAIRRNAGGFRELIVAVGGLEIFVRPFRTSYPNDDLYDAGTNPLGWRQIHSIPGTFPGSPLFFNASVTEAQMMISNAPQRLKLTVNGDSISLQRLSTLGHRVEQGTLTQLANEHSSNDLCSSPVQGGPQCTQYETCDEGNVYCARTEYSGTTSRESSSNKTTTFDHPDLAVVCVDYRGDTEVFCTVRHEAIIDNSTSHINFSHEAQYTNVNQCGHNDSWSGHANSNGTADTTTLHRVVDVFQLGDAMVPLDGGLSIESRTETTTASGTPLSLPNVQVAYSIHASNTYYKAKIMYADARYGILQYWSDELARITDASGTTTAQLGGDDVFRANADLPWVDRRTQKVVLLAPERHELLSQVTETPGTQGWGLIVLVHGGRTHFYDAGGCNSPFDQTTPIPPQTYEEDYQNFVQTYVLAPSHMGLARDLSGRLAISTPVPQRATWESVDFTFPSTWSYLSAGDMGALLPTAPANSTYGPIGVLE